MIQELQDQLIHLGHLLGCRIATIDQAIGPQVRILNGTQAVVDLLLDHTVAYMLIQIRTNTDHTLVDLLIAIPPNSNTAITAGEVTLGLTVRFRADEVKPYDYQKILDNAKDLPSFATLNRVMLRSMQKARYSAENLGHFGLASDCYCHFTSPIRRYPDLCIHRIIKQVINGGYAEAKTQYGEFVAEAAKQASACERRATEAERDVDDLYKTMYMSEHIGKEYDAVISGVTSFGIFAELPNTIEGIIPIESLFGEFKYDADRFALIGKNESYRIGERLKVKVTDVDFYRRRTEFRLLEKIEKDD